MSINLNASTLAAISAIVANPQVILPQPVQPKYEESTLQAITAIVANQLQFLNSQEKEADENAAAAMSSLCSDISSEEFMDCRRFAESIVLRPKPRYYPESFVKICGQNLLDKIDLLSHQISQIVQRNTNISIRVAKCFSLVDSRWQLIAQNNLVKESWRFGVLYELKEFKKFIQIDKREPIGFFSVEDAFDSALKSIRLAKKAFYKILNKFDVSLEVKKEREEALKRNPPNLFDKEIVDKAMVQRYFSKKYLEDCKKEIKNVIQLNRDALEMIERALTYVDEEYAIIANKLDKLEEGSQNQKKYENNLNYLQKQGKTMFYVLNKKEMLYYIELIFSIEMIIMKRFRVNEEPKAKETSKFNFLYPLIKFVSGGVVGGTAASGTDTAASPIDVKSNS